MLQVIEDLPDECTKFRWVMGGAPPRSAPEAPSSSTHHHLQAVFSFLHPQVIEDLRDECTKFGQVLAVTVPRPPDAANAAAAFGTGNFGKVRAQPAGG